MNSGVEYYVGKRVYFKYKRGMLFIYLVLVVYSTLGNSIQLKVNGARRIMIGNPIYLHRMYGLVGFLVKNTL